MDGIITGMQKEIKEVKETVERVDGVSSQNSLLITSLEAEIKSLHVTVDDQINRSLRKTLIFKGIPENPKETWEATEKSLATAISKTLDMDITLAERLIERAHRGRRNDKYDGPRHIYAKFYSWKDSERIKEDLARLQKANKKLPFRAEQMYSQSLTKRRNIAMTERKSLIESKSIVSGYLAFPATLMIKLDSSDTKYVSHKAF